MTRATLPALALLTALATAAPPADAQGPTASRRLQPEVRGDVIIGDHPALQVGGGVHVPLGYYVRVGAIAAGGVGLGDAGGRGSARADLLVRFLLDPFRQARYGLSAGGGLSTRFEAGGRVTPLLLLALDLEGRRRRSGWSPAVQVGLGGGARLGVALRRGETAAR